MAAVVVAGALAGTPSAAEESPPDGVTFLGWSLSNVRLGVEYGPDYYGSDDYGLGPAGAVVLTRKSGPPSLGGPDDGVSVSLAGTDTVDLGIVGRWRSGRDGDDDLQGMDKVDWTVEVGGFVNVWPSDWLRLRGEIRRGLNGFEGWAASASADLMWSERRWAFSAGPRLAWADDHFTETYFGVTPAEAARSPFGIAPYAPTGSTYAVGAVANAEYRFSRRWSASLLGSYRRLGGDASDSPLVSDLGSRDQFSLTTSVRYWFGR